jgi:hypothetical protein
MHGTHRLVIIFILFFVNPVTVAANTGGTTGLLYDRCIQNDTAVNPKRSTVNADEREYILKPGENLEEKVRKNLFVKATLNKNACYIGEPVLVTYKLYSRLNTRSAISRQPSLEGFSVFDMVDIISIKETVENVQGKPFKVYILRKSQVVPLQSGRLEIDAMEIQNKVHFIKQKAVEGAGSGLNDLFDKMIEEEKAPAVEKTIIIRSAPVILEVKPVPEETPPRFNGAIGQFSIHASMVTPEIKAREAGVLKIEITGTGNLAMVEPPQVQWPKNIDSFGLRSSEKLDGSVFPLRGTKTIEYTFMPVEQGEYIIPGIELCYFDPVKESFQTIRTAADTFRVQPGSKSTVTSPPVSTDVKNTQGNSLFSHLLKPVYLITFSLMVIGLILFIRYRIRQNALEKKPAGPAPAPPPPDPWLKARALLAEKAFGQLYGEINRVLWDKLAQQLQIPLTELNKQTIVPALRLKGWNEEEIARLVSVLTECERNVYIQEYRQESEAEAILAKASALMEDLSEVRANPEA